MEIISVSMEAGKVTEMGVAMKLMGLKSRSKLVRAALASLLGEYQIISRLKGRQTVVFMITRGKGINADLFKVAHSFGHVIKTNIHHHTRKGCLDVLIVDGNAEVIKQMYREVRKLKGTVSTSVI